MEILRLNVFEVGVEVGALLIVASKFGVGFSAAMSFSVAGQPKESDAITAKMSRHFAVKRWVEDAILALEKTGQNRVKNEQKWTKTWQN